MGFVKLSYIQAIVVNLAYQTVKKLKSSQPITISRFEFCKRSNQDELAAYFSRSINRSPTLRALAIIVNAGLTAALDGKKLPSTT